MDLNKTLISKKIDNIQQNIKLLSGIIIAITGLSSLVFNFFNSYINKEYSLLIKFCIIYIGLLIFTISFCNEIIHQKSSNPGFINIPLFTTKKVRLAKNIRIIVILLSLIFPIIALNIYNKKQQECKLQENLTGILISNFSHKTEDVFSSNLVNYIEENNFDNKTSIKPLNRFIDAKLRLKAKDSLAPLMQCFNKGMIIFGSRNLEENSFYCNVFLYNMDKNTYQENGKLITIQEPDLIEININYQVKYIGDLILGLINYLNKNYLEAIEKFNYIIKNQVIDNKSKSLIYLLEGNSFIKIGDINKARKCYEIGSKFDKNNLNIIENLKKVSKESLSSDSISIVDKIIPITADSEIINKADESINNISNRGLLLKKRIFLKPEKEEACCSKLDISGSYGVYRDSLIVHVESLKFNIETSLFLRSIELGIIKDYPDKKGWNIFKVSDPIILNKSINTSEINLDEKFLIKNVDFTELKNYRICFILTIDDKIDSSYSHYVYMHVE